jgi:hypothetical protein
MKTLEYFLVATTFTKEQCKALLRPILKVALPKCKVQRNLPRKLVHGTLRTRGLNLLDIYWTQLVEHLQSITRHMNPNSPSRDLHEENMDLVQYHVGSSDTFWDLPYKKYGHLVPDVRKKII